SAPGRQLMSRVKYRLQRTCRVEAASTHGAFAPNLVVVLWSQPLTWYSASIGWLVSLPERQAAVRGCSLIRPMPICLREAPKHDVARHKLFVCNVGVMI